jgi:hypothetical protein
MNLPATEARLLAPRQSLASCIRAAVVRNTMGAQLTATQRVNRYAASPWCSITWHIHGTGVMLEPPLGQMDPWNPILYGGPQTRPTITSNPGDVHFGDWLRSMAVRAAGSDWSRSVRSAERRIKSWAGQSMRALRRLDRIEQSYADARQALDEGTVSWAEVAAQGGFSDQAHLVREVRDLTGLTPAQLARARREDESFWMYRIWA